jgi:hypothetical protein
MTDITVFTQSLGAEDLSWDLTPDRDQAYIEGGTIDLVTDTALWNAAQHWPKGFIPSGTVLALRSGRYVPYLNSAADAQNVAAGVLRASVQVVQLNGQLKTKIGVAVMKAFGVISQARLPFTSSTAAAGGYIDATGITDLPRIHFAA